MISDDLVKGALDVFVVAAGREGTTPEGLLNIGSILLAWCYCFYALRSVRKLQSRMIEQGLGEKIKIPLGAGLVWVMIGGTLACGTGMVAIQEWFPGHMRVERQDAAPTAALVRASPTVGKSSLNGVIERHRGK